MTTPTSMSVDTAIALVILSGCQAVAGLDVERLRDVPECAEGEQRCVTGGTETCITGGTWQSGPPCAGRCVAGSCVGAPQAWIGAGHRHTCAAWEGRVACWGEATYGQIGRAATTSCSDGDHTGPCDPAPGWVDGLESNMSAVTALANHTCAIVDGGLRCWGDGSYGQLGDGSHDASAVPVNVKRLDGHGQHVVQASAGGGVSDYVSAAHTCALGETGTVFCWGANCGGQLGSSAFCADVETFPHCGEGSGATINVPAEAVLLPNDRRYLEVRAGGGHSCVLADSGEVLCWGWNFLGQVDGAVADQLNECALLPQPLPDVPRFVQISAGGTTTCGVTLDQRVVCWGRNDRFTLGGGDKKEHGPRLVDGVPPVVEVAVGHGGTACARAVSGEVWCWGGNEHAQAGVMANAADEPGNGEVEPGEIAPAPVARIHDAVALGVGDDVVCAFVTATGELELGAGENAPGARLATEPRASPPSRCASSRRRTEVRWSLRRDLGGGGRMSPLGPAITSVAF
jgi:alpha-tubulin suppressor-like RCC1 family protein